jgi:hypothetical protein
MKRPVACFVALLLAFAACAADTVKFVREYTEGQVDKFNVTIAMVFPTATWTFKALDTLTVKKVYPDGEVDIETAATDMKADVPGQDVPTPDQKSTRRFGKDGMPAGDLAAGGPQFDYARTEALLFGRDLTVGNDVAIEWTAPKDAKSKIKGTFNVQSVKDGLATVVSKLQIWNSGTGDKPMQATFTTLIEVVTSKIQKVDGVVTDLPIGADSPTPKQMKITRVRVPAAG